MIAMVMPNSKYGQNYILFVLLYISVTLLVLFPGGYILSAILYRSSLCTLQVGVIKTDKSEVYSSILSYIEPGGKHKPAE